MPGLSWRLTPRIPSSPRFLLEDDLGFLPAFVYEGPTRSVMDVEVLILRRTAADFSCQCQPKEVANNLLNRTISSSWTKGMNPLCQMAVEAKDGQAMVNPMESALIDGMSLTFGRVTKEGPRVRNGTKSTPKSSNPNSSPSQPSSCSNHQARCPTRRDYLQWGII